MVTSFTSYENFIAADLPWPSDHKAVFATLNFLLLSDNPSNLSGKGFSAYPNPVSDELIINLAGTDKDILVEIINFDGKKLFNAKFNNEKSIIINTNNFTSGVYILRIQTGENTEVIKILIE